MLALLVAHRVIRQRHHVVRSAAKGGVACCVDLENQIVAAGGEVHVVGRYWLNLQFRRVGAGQAATLS